MKTEILADKKYTFIDLFAGCGGLSEGFLQTKKFEALAHVEWEMPMVATLRHRLVRKWGHTEKEATDRVVCFDIQKTDELLNGNWSEESRIKYGKYNSELIATKGLKGLCEGKTLDLIIGGPPCQAYSIAGRAQSPTGMKDDYRNYLFESFVKIVDAFKPSVFIFENVPGLLSACPGGKPVKERIFEAFSNIGYEIRTPEKLKDSVYCAEDYETPQKRNRLIIIGVKQGGNLQLEDFYNSLTAHKSTEPCKTVRDAIGNLPALIPLPEVEKIGRSKVSHTQVSGEPVDKHYCRYHGARDQKLFRKWLENNMNDCSQEEKMAYYTEITGHTSNHIKYRNIEWDKPSPTVVAHLQKDGYMFIHPDIKQLRSITIREAALLQSFPIDFEFIASNPFAYKMIGNAVPVQFAKNIALSIYDVLAGQQQ